MFPHIFQIHLGVTFNPLDGMLFLLHHPQKSVSPWPPPYLCIADYSLMSSHFPYCTKIHTWEYTLGNNTFHEYLMSNYDTVVAFLDIFGCNFFFPWQGKKESGFGGYIMKRRHLWKILINGCYKFIGARAILWYYCNFHFWNFGENYKLGKIQA